MYVLKNLMYTSQIGISTKTMVDYKGKQTYHALIYETGKALMFVARKLIIFQLPVSFFYWLCGF